MANDLFIDDDASDEDIDDSKAGEADLRNAVLYNTDWTVETIVNQIKKKRIDLSPSFQRRDAWTIKHKSLFIESILLNFPIPSITLAETQQKNLILVDGKQRLSTLAQFMGEAKEEIDGKITESIFNNFKLTGLSQLSDLNGKNYQDLIASYPLHTSTFENFSIRTNIIRGWKHDEILYSIFYRLNSGSVKLSPQELRQSLFPGNFSTFILEYSNHSKALRDIFPGTEPDFRMRDVELITRYLSLFFFIENYNGDLKKILDYTVSQLNKNWDVMEPKVTASLEHFENIYSKLVDVFGRKHIFKKWLNSEWETRTNRAIFDTIMYNFKEKSALDMISSHADDIIDAFKQASNSDDFQNAIEKTTKTTVALYNRISILAATLKGKGFPTPEISLVNNRIKVL